MMTKDSRFTLTIEHPDGTCDTLNSGTWDDLSPFERIAKASDITDATVHMPPLTKVYLTIKSKANEQGDNL